MAELRDNTARGRFELDEPGGVVFADYRRAGDRLVINHVETPPTMRGGGAAGRLMEAVAALAGREGLTIVPVCSYAAAWMSRHSSN